MEPFRVRPTLTLRVPCSGSRRQPIKKATPQGRGSGGSGSRATIPGMPRPVRPRHDRRTPLASFAVVIALIVSACGASSPSAVPSVGPSASAVAPTASSSARPTGSASAPSASAAANADAIYDSVEQQVVQIRGLQPKRTVERQFITKDELLTMLTQMFDKESPPDYVAATERLYKALGLIPADSDLRQLTLDLLGGGVVGFYRNDQGKLYVVSEAGAPGPNERFYFAHEYDHALQDQNTTVFKDQDGIHDQSDRILARQAVYEGDATLLMTLWAAANLKQADLLELIAAGSDPEVAAVLARTPAILRAPLEFPYTTGFGFVQAAYGKGDWAAVNDFYGRMPASTEQILHPEKYASAEAPVKVAMPSDLATRMGTGWTVPLQDTFGELQMGIWLKDGGAAAYTAAAAGWGGDRLAVMNGPNGAWAVAIQTAWDTDKDAAEFDAAAATAIGKAEGVAKVLPGDGGKTRWVVVAKDAAHWDAWPTHSASPGRRVAPAPVAFVAGASRRKAFPRWFQPNGTILPVACPRRVTAPIVPLDPNHRESAVVGGPSAARAGRLPLGPATATSIPARRSLAARGRWRG